MTVGDDDDSGILATISTGGAGEESSAGQVQRRAGGSGAANPARALDALCNGVLVEVGVEVKDNVRASGENYQRNSG